MKCILSIAFMCIAGACIHAQSCPSGATPIQSGGTCATTAAGALANLGGAALAGAAFTGGVSGPSLPITPYQFGLPMDPTGVADSTAAFQAAINYAGTIPGELVTVPVGTYKVCGLQPYVHNTFAIMRLAGPANDRQRGNASGPQYGNAQSGPWSSFSTTLQCPSGDMFTIPSTATGGTYISVSGLALLETSSTNSGHIFNFGSSPNAVDFALTDVLLGQYNPAKSWIVGSGGMQEMTMDHIFGAVAAGNTVPAVQLDGTINVIDIGHTNFYYVGSGSTYSQHYLFELNQNSGTASNVHIHDSLCESATAGCFNLNDVSNASIDDVNDYDPPTTPTAPFITIGSASGQVELKSVYSNNLANGWSTPDIVCPSGVCEFHNSQLSNAYLGGVFLDQRTLLAAHYLDYTPAQQTDAALMGVWSTKDGFSGGGMTGNLATDSDGLAAASWGQHVSGAGSAPTVTTGQNDPLGGTSAVKIIFAIPASPAWDDLSEWRQIVSPATGTGTFTLSMWVKSCSGNVTLEINDNNIGDAITVGTSWQRYYTTFFSTLSTARPAIGLNGNVGGSGSACVYVYGAQFTPGIDIHPYVSTTYAGAAVPIAPGEYVNGKPVISSLTNDCTLANPNAITCTKSNGVAFGSLAFLNTSPATPSSSGTGATLVGPREYYVCTGTCAPTLPVPPVSGSSYEFCVSNDMGVSTAITFGAIGSGVMYPKGDGTGWGTAGTGTFTMPAAAGNKVCFVSKDATHYNLESITGSGTAN